MIIIGERLNSSRPAVHGAMARKDKSYLIEQARLQVLAGAGYLDVNAATLLERESDFLRWMVPLLQDAVGVSLSIDTPNPAAMAAALSVHRGRAILNSLSGEKRTADQLLPLVNEYRPRVIVLCLDDRGPATTPDRALAIAELAAGRLVRRGLHLEDIYVDPLVHSAATDRESVVRFLTALRKIKKKLPGIKTVAGLSNISFGLPRRRLLNRTFLVLALEAGLDTVICDPLDRELQMAAAAAEALLGRQSDWKTLRRARLRKVEETDRQAETDRPD